MKCQACQAKWRRLTTNRTLPGPRNHKFGHSKKSIKKTHKEIISETFPVFSGTMKSFQKLQKQINKSIAYCQSHKSTENHRGWVMWHRSEPNAKWPPDVDLDHHDQYGSESHHLVGDYAMMGTTNNLDLDIQLTRIEMNIQILQTEQAERGTA